MLYVNHYIHCYNDSKSSLTHFKRTSKLSISKYNKTEGFNRNIIHVSNHSKQTSCLNSGIYNVVYIGED